MADLTVLWMILDLFVVLKCFVHTASTNDDNRIVLSPCCIPSMNLLLIHVYVSHMHHFPQWPYCLVEVALVIPLVM